MRPAVRIRPVRTIYSSIDIAFFDLNVACESRIKAQCGPRTKEYEKNKFLFFQLLEVHNLLRMVKVIVITLF
jgi:hypothetical protein